MVVSYLLLLPFNLGSSKGTGEQNVGLLIGFYIMVAYAVISLVLTVIIANQGGFNWISDSTLWRNVGIGVLWLGMIAGIYYCMELRQFWHVNQNSGLFRLLTLPVFFGAVWLPLLMLVPYAILLNSEWRDIHSTNLHKFTLVFACAFGILLPIIPKTFFTQGAINKDKLHLSDSMQTINADKSIESLLPFTSKVENQQLRNAALAKIIAHKNWEDELITILKKNNPYTNCSVYAFLSDNKIEHPERFIEPINNSILTLAFKIQEFVDKEFSRYTLHVEKLKVESLCHVLNVQFKEYSTAFRPNIIVLQEVLEMPLSGESS